MQTGMRNFDTGTSAARRCFGGWGGITHAKQKALSTFGSCLHRGFAATAIAQAPAQPPMFATTKVEGTDNVYVFRYQGHQSMFVVTPAGVIVTDPISYGRPQAAKTYLEEIRKFAKAPIKYLIYSHHHYDHIAGGKVFKDAGATVIAHRRAKERLAELKGLDVVIPDQVVDGKTYDPTWRHHTRSHLHRPQPFRLFDRHAAAERKNSVRCGFQFARRGAVTPRSE